MLVAKQALAGVLLLGFLAACKPEPAAKKQPSVADLVKAPPGPVKDVVRAAMRDADTDGRRLVVYVGATWCEPCRVFLNALNAGALPPSLADLRVLKFDDDVDHDRLLEANYGGQMIPRFVRPGPDGTGSRQRFEGSIKGPEAMLNMVPRLEAILGEP